MNGEHRVIYEKIDCIDKKAIKMDKTMDGIKKDTEHIKEILEKQLTHCNEVTSNYNFRIDDLESSRDKAIGTVKASSLIIFLVSLITITKLLGWW